MLCYACLRDHPEDIRCKDVTEPCIMCQVPLRSGERHSVIETIGSHSQSHNPVCIKCVPGLEADIYLDKLTRQKESRQ